jgi:hypothetical protein
VPVVVHGLREISAAYAKLERETRLGMRGTLRTAAEPVQHDAEALAQAKITRIGPRWWKMRVGVTRSLVYVAPRTRGVRRGDDPRGRPNLAKLLLERAMEPALEQNEGEVVRAVDRFLDHVVADFNH